MIEVAQFFISPSPDFIFSSIYQISYEELVNHNALKNHQNLKLIIAELGNFCENVTKNYIRLLITQIPTQKVEINVDLHSVMAHAQSAPNVSAMSSKHPNIFPVYSSSSAVYTPLNQQSQVILRLKEDNHFQHTLNFFLLYVVMITKAILTVVETAIERINTCGASYLEKLKCAKNCGYDHLRLLNIVYDQCCFQKSFENLPNYNEFQRSRVKLLNALNAIKIGNNCFTEKLISNDDFMETVLGLENFSLFLSNIDSETRFCHCYKYWVLKFLENNYTESGIVEFCDNTIDKKSVLQKLGFKEMHAQYIANLFSDNDNDIWSTQTPLYWANSYMEHFFMYNVLLNDLANFDIFPFGNDKIQQWLCAPPNDYNNSKWTFINLTYPSDVRQEHFDIPLEKDNNSKVLITDWINQLETNDHRFVFHATDSMNAKTICISGIELVFGSSEQDFSSRKGFYLSKSITTAIKWCYRRSTNHAVTTKAVLIYRINEELLKTFKHLSLSEDRELWERVISAHRNDDRTKMKSYSNYDYITGPMCYKFKDVLKGLRSDYDGFLNGKWQMCARTKKFSSFLNSCLYRVIFIRCE